MEEKQKQVRKFGMRDKIAYAMGDFGCNMSFALNATITTFYTMYVGLSTEIMALLIILLKIWDGVNDPIMGAIMDKFRPKKGGSKFKPFILWGSIALVVSGAMVFLPIGKLGEEYTWLKIVVCIVGYLVWDTAYTVVNVPYGSMANVITDVPEERASLSMWRSIGAMLANLPIMILLPMIMYRDMVDANGNTVLNPYILNEEGSPYKPIEVLVGENVFITALIMGVVGLIAFFILIKFTTERIKPEESQQVEKQKINYWEVIKSFAKNRAAVAMTIASIFQLVMLNGLTVATNALYKDFFGMGQESGIFSLISYLPLVAVMPLIVPLVKKYGKKEASQWPMLLGVLGGILMMVLPRELFLSGIGGIVLWCLLQLLVSFSFAIFGTVGWAMVADCIDYQELKTGRREEGTVYAIYSLGRKIAQGFGAAAVLLMLGWIGFKEAGWDSTLGVEIPSFQTADVANNIRLLIGGVYLVCCVVQFVMLKFVYPLTKGKVEEMNIKLGRANEVDVFVNED